MIQKMIQFSYTNVIDDESIYTYRCYTNKTQKMIQYLHTEIAEDDLAEIDDEDV